ncbi:MAG: DNA polymerase III subunit alpha [Bacillota bacterium]
MLAHLHVHSPFSFLDGASSIQRLVARAAEMGVEALAITDHNNLSATVKLHKAAAQAGIKAIIGAEVTLEDGSHLVLLARDARGYANLCRLLTRAHLDHPRKEPRVSRSSLEELGEGLVVLSGCRRGEVAHLLLHGKYQAARAAASWYQQRFGRDYYLELGESYLPGSARLARLLRELAGQLGLELVLTGNVHYASGHDFWVHDILTCVRTLTRIDDICPERRLNAENYLKTREELLLACPGWERALEVAGEIGKSCGPVLDLKARVHPEFPLPAGENPAAVLRQLVGEGARRRYPRVSKNIKERLEHELDIICRLGFEDYFLLVWDVVQFARNRGIRHAGRGSAADSAVAYCLGITEVDAIGRGLLFERFMSLERAQLPDIDVDFDARHRDLVTQYVYGKYGKEHVATVCTYNTFQGRSAVRDIGKALGFPAGEIDALAKRLPWVKSGEIRDVLNLPELRVLQLDQDRLELLLDCCAQVAGHPRFLGTHLGGVVITRPPLVELTPLQLAAKGVTVTQFDKEDVEDLGLIKLDLLSLRTLSAVEDTVKVLELDYDRIPAQDRATYQLLNSGQTIGVFQLESPAQRALQSRLGADNLEDLVASVALIRPGPIKGNMVEPFVARRQGKEPVTYADPRLRRILAKTYGVVLFQEQVIEIATVIANFSPGDADRLRRVMTHARSHRDMGELGQKFVERAIANGTPPQVAQEIFTYMAGYASYGFCEAHAASFANTAYKTAYLVQHHPAEFFAAILSNSPMGYYPPGTIIVEARRRGVGVLRPSVNYSQASCEVQDGNIRIGLGQLRGMTRAGLESLLKARQAGPFLSLADFCARVSLPRPLYQSLVLCGAADDFGANRRKLLWELEDILAHEGPAGGFDLGAPGADWGGVEDFAFNEKLKFEYELLGMGMSGHPLEAVRDGLRKQGVVTGAELSGLGTGRLVKLAGYPVRPHRPPTRSGRITVFVSLEDETGLTDLTVFENIYHRSGQYLFTEPVLPLLVEGKLERRGQGVSITVRKLAPLVS